MDWLSSPQWLYVLGQLELAGAFLNGGWVEVGVTRGVPWAFVHRCPGLER